MERTKTTSISFPMMLDTVHNSVGVRTNNDSIVNRTRLLLLTEPTSMYNSPEIGVGMTKYLWQYNTENTKAMLQDNIRDQIRRYEPCVDADATIFVDGLLFSESEDTIKSDVDFQSLKFTIGLASVFGEELRIELNSDEIKR